MNTRKIYLLALVLFNLLHLTAQDIKKISWGKIPSEELSMTIYPEDSSAEAVVLDDIGEIYFYYTNGFVYSLTKHKRIKILKEGGIDQGDIIINYYYTKGSENIKGLKAQIIAPDGTVTKVKDENIFDNKVTDALAQRKIACPNVQVGSIIEYSYKIESDRFTLPRDWNFQTNIPVRHSQIEFIPATELTYIKLKNGFQTIHERGDFLIATNLPALKEEPFISSMEDYRTKVSFQLHAYTNSRNVYTPYLSEWNSVSKILNESFTFGSKIYNGGQVSDTWNMIKDEVAGMKDSLAMAKLIYNKVLNQVKWDENYRLFADKKGDDVFKSQTGTSSEINALIINLMRKADLDANPVVTNPRSEGRFNPTYPVIDNLNHVFGSVVIGGKRILFDGTHQYRPFGIIDEEDLTTDALLIQKEFAKVIPVEIQNENESHTIDLTLTGDGHLQGNINSKYKFLSMEDEIAIKEDKSFEKVWKNRLHVLGENVEIKDYEGTLGENDFKSKLSFKAEFEHDFNEDLLYIPTGIISQFLKNPFKLITRKFPIDFGHQMSETVLYSLVIPENYEIEALPENIVISTTNKEVTYSMTCSSLNNKIQVVRKTEIKAPYISQTEYGAVRGIFDKIEVKNNDLIVLKKKG